MRSRTKSKMGKEKSYANRTGGGPPMPKEDTLTTIEEEIGFLIKPVSVEGHDVRESVANFDYCDILPKEHDYSNNIDFVTVNMPKNSDEIVEETISKSALECEKENSLTNVTHKVMKSSKKRITKKKDNFLNASAATSSYEKYLEKKISIKQEYYEKKLKLCRNFLN